MKAKKTTITREGRFEYAHRLMHHKGKCKNIHGHSGRYQVVISSPSLNPLTDMIVDFTDLKACIKPIEDAFDHAIILNNKDVELIDALKSQGFDVRTIVGEPTAENLASLFAGMLAHSDLPDFVIIESVTIWETANNSATFYPVTEIDA